MPVTIGALREIAPNETRVGLIPEVADKFAQAISGRTEIRVIPGAGHLAELDKPDEVAAAILEWTR